MLKAVLTGLAVSAGLAQDGLVDARHHGHHSGRVLTQDAAGTAKPVIGIDVPLPDDDSNDKGPNDDGPGDKVGPDDDGPDDQGGHRGGHGGGGYGVVGCVRECAPHEKNPFTVCDTKFSVSFDSICDALCAGCEINDLEEGQCPDGPVLH